MGGRNTCWAEIENKLRGDSVTRGDAGAAGEDHLALSALTKKKK